MLGGTLVCARFLVAGTIALSRPIRKGDALPWCLGIAELIDHILDDVDVYGEDGDIEDEKSHLSELLKRLHREIG